MKIFITGGAGFIGSYIAEYYAEKDCEIILFDNMSRTQYLPKSGKTYDYTWEHLLKTATITRIPGDVRDFEALETAMEEADVIFHAAAHTHVDASFKDPAEDLSDNILGSFNVLEAARALPKKPVMIYLSSSKIYGVNVNRLKITETGGISRFDAPYEKGITEEFSVDGYGKSPFGVSKLAADLYFQEYAHLYGFKTGIFRLSTVYGPRQFGIEEQSWPVKIILDVMLGRPVNVEGSGNTTRDLLFAPDLVKALDAFIKSDYQQGVFNIGGGVENLMTPMKLIGMLEEKLKTPVKINNTPTIPYEQRVFYVNNNKIDKLLGWKPETTTEAGVDAVIKWVEDNKKIFN